MTAGGVHVFPPSRDTAYPIPDVLSANSAIHAATTPPFESAASDVCVS